MFTYPHIVMESYVLLTLIITILASSSAAQLLGCDSFQCPHHPNDTERADCILGSITAENIGVTNLITDLGPQPLTWTIGQSENRSMSNSVVGRDFYLGQPPSLNLQLQLGAPDCAIFFHGIAPSLRFPSTSGIDQGKSSGTCADVLTISCVEALQSQIAVVLATNATIDCTSLAVVLQSTAPTSCPVQNGNWGAVSGKSISGADAPDPLSLSDCHPTIGSDYSLTRIDGVSSTPLHVAGLPYDDFVLGITPILTIFRHTIISKPETHLTCLKVITSEGNTANEQSSASTAIAPARAFGYSTPLILGLLSFL